MDEEEQLLQLAIRQSLLDQGGGGEGGEEGGREGGGGKDGEVRGYEEEMILCSTQTEDLLLSSSPRSSLSPRLSKTRGC